ncbi:TNT domain-containing protein [Sporolactobacillus laevolacticus]|uniref:TNT domain-containing protein n=1 Tax=Sporolactobacillus laevolacticus TaxID=33018 RepID=UPI0025B5C4D0|nr:TNT domain-containing protein [Sporolactobacillus laevolacticus]MDN3955294.1 TNT domain-containing protein [Sporolactobacillus laevolacticus]
MGHSVSYKEGAWNDMGDAINRMSAWRSGIFDRMRAMDQVFRNLRDTVDDLDEDHRIHFSYKSMSGSLDKLNDDYQKLYNFTGEAGEAVSRHIDHPFFTKMDAFVEAMEKISIDKITTKNTLNVKELQSTSQLASVATYEKVKKKEITLDDIFCNDSLMETSLKSEYETFKAMATSKKAEKVNFDQYKEAIQYSRGFHYKSIRDKQIDKEFWVNLGIGTAIVILTIACPPAGAVASITYGAMQMTDAVTGTSMISGRKLSTEERITEGAFGLLDLAPGAAALRGAGAFSALGRTGTKGLNTVGELSQGLKRTGQIRLLTLKTPAIRMAAGVKDGTRKVIENIKSVERARVQKVGEGTSTKKLVSAEKVAVNISVETKEAVNPEDLLKQTSCSSADLYKYLKGIDPHFAEDYLKARKWPDEIQIPKSSKVLKSDGKIDWSQVPNDGFTLDDLGNPNKKNYTPKIGEVIDRYGHDGGRFTSPVIDGKPYSYEQRSLPYLEDISKYHQYEIIGDFSNIKRYYENCSNTGLKSEIDDYMTTWGLTFNDLTIQKGEIAPGFGSSGGGIQYQLPLPINMLKDLGLIKPL